MNSESQIQLDLDYMRPDPALAHEVDRGHTLASDDCTANG